MFGKLFGWITGDTPTAGKVVDAVMDTGDALFYTDEEKARAAQKRLDWQLEYIKATNPQNVARRMIAFMVVSLWVVLILMGVGAWAVNEDFADYIFNVMDELVTMPFMMIIGFYFATHLLRGLPKRDT